MVAWSWYRPIYAGTTSPTLFTITSPTATTTTNTIWWSSAGTQTATTSIWADTNTTSNPYNTYSVVDNGNGLVWMQQRAAALQAAQMQQAYYAQQAAQLSRPLGLGQWASAAPAIITHQEQSRRDQEAYRRAVEEHDEQEAARILRLIEARERNEAERRRHLAEHAQANREAHLRHAAAHDRARELLIEHLTPAQRETFIEHGWFVVEGGRSKTKYRIRNAGAAGNIDVLDRGNRATARLCCHAPSHIPLGDQWLSQKIMLELAEDDFLRIANRTNVR